jgi:NADPH-dependent 7-cyano-7-deazaguanine reductase QueF-like protein
MLLCPAFIVGQNLLPNPSFEDTVLRTTPLYLPADWNAATREGFNYFTPYNDDTQQHLLFNVPYNLNGYQVTRTGEAYIGMKIYSLYSLGSNQRNGRREYMQAQLNHVLQADSTYCFQIYLSLADSTRFASRNQLGVYFSNTAVYENHWEHLPYNPQIIVSPNDYVVEKEEWVLYSSTYTASGGEEYITIGNFNDTTSLDTLFVGGGDSSNISFINTYYYIDDVFLGHCDSLPDTTIGLRENALKNKLKLYPNPVGEQFYVSYSSQEQLQFQLYNLMGQKVEAAVQKEGSRYRFSSGHLPQGVYLLRVKDRKLEEVFKLLRE